MPVCGPNLSIKVWRRYWPLLAHFEQTMRTIGNGYVLVVSASLVIACELACGLASSGTSQGNAFGRGWKRHSKEHSLSGHRGGRPSVCRRESAATEMTGYTDLISCTSDSRCG